MNQWPNSLVSSQPSCGVLPVIWMSCDDYAWAQRAYRGRDPAGRQADTRYAEPLGDVLNKRCASIDQLADDLSGTYGPHRSWWDGYDAGTQGIGFEARIFSGITEIGGVLWYVVRDDAGSLVAHYLTVGISEAAVMRVERGEFSDALCVELEEFFAALYAELEGYWRRSGVDRIEMFTIGQHGEDTYAANGRGFTWNRDQKKLRVSLDNVMEAARNLEMRLSQAGDVLAEMVERLGVFHPYVPELSQLAVGDPPELSELADLATVEEPDLGRQLLDNTRVHVVKYLSRREADEPPVRSRGDVRPIGELQTYRGRSEGADTTPDGGSHSVVEDYFQNRWHPPALDGIDGPHSRHEVLRLAEVLTEMYGREVRIDPELKAISQATLFRAVGSDTHKATYGEWGQTLHYLGRDSAAIVSPGWNDPRLPGVFVAFNIGSEIRYYVPSSEEFSVWPSPWAADTEDLSTVSYVDAHGDPLCPSDETVGWLVAKELINDRWFALTKPRKSWLIDERNDVGADLAASMDQGLAPDSLEANALAGRYFANLGAGDLGYMWHRYEAGKLLTEPQYRDPYEEIAPGLARYVREVILANAKRHRRG